MANAGGDKQSSADHRQDTPTMSQGITLGLARIVKLLDVLGNPHLAVPIIHVAGTNGKGSVCAYIDSILRSSDIRVGRFTSPHLTTVRDSITLQGRTIAEVDYLKAKSLVDKANLQHTVQASPFELLTATAFQAFKNEDPPLELAIVEVGMGGATDATNVCPNPLVTVITAIDMDHQAFLGNTVEEIARVKAGIIKTGRPCILGPQAHPEVGKAIQAIAARHGAPLIQIKPSEIGDESKVQLVFRGQAVQAKLPLLGSYQAANAATAVAAIEALTESTSFVKSDHITPATVKEGLESTRWPGRLDWVNLEERKILVDGAHNPASILELANYLGNMSKQKTTFILALSNPRDPASLLAPLLTQASVDRKQTQVIAVGFTQPEGMPWVSHVAPDAIVQAAKQAGVQASTATDIREAIKTANTLGEGRVVICGSLYLVADVYRYLYKQNALQDH